MNHPAATSPFHEILQASYRPSVVNHVWARSEFKSIAYSDGDQVEDRILDIVKNAKDVSVLSSEFREHCTDWATLYHLSSARANVLRPLKSHIKGDVLEIGAGCGAITRFLGECGANVLALEGSLRRASIARERTRDLSNVTVLAEKFSDFEVAHKFDVVTLIGVLEYANLFTQAADPHLTMLEKVKHLLKPAGVLIIAIENQLGLKYFAGAHEDHLGKPMIGLEDRYTDKTAKTFGRLELTRLLNRAGFSTTNFMACFPDYKLPSSIITYEGFEHPKFDAGALAAQSVGKDPLKPEYCCFSSELVWSPVVRNGLGMDLANSFLVCAGSRRTNSETKCVLAYHYSSDRLPQFTKETTFALNESGDVEITHKSLAANIDKLSANVELAGETLKFQVSPEDSYSYGKALSADFPSLVTEPGWSHASLQSFLKLYLKSLVTVGALATADIPLETKIDGRFIDCIPGNLIFTDDGTTQFIDTEWTLTTEIPLSRLLFRALLGLVAMPSDFALDESGRQYTYGEFLKLCFKLVGKDLDDVALLALFDEEMRLQKAVSGFCQDAEYISKLVKSSLPRKKYWVLTPHYFREVARLNHELKAITGSRKWRIAVKISEMIPGFMKHFIRQTLSRPH
jgi:2-polyprenyl-3-methyl-5-hydroxy-6-metoxy-1,4-benzoquinol methylase